MEEGATTAGEPGMDIKELATTLATLILYDGGEQVTEEKLVKVLQAAKVDGGLYPKIFAKGIHLVDFQKLLGLQSPSGQRSEPDPWRIKIEVIHDTSWCNTFNEPFEVELPQGGVTTVRHFFETVKNHKNNPNRDLNLMDLKPAWRSNSKWKPSRSDPDQPVFAAGLKNGDHLTINECCECTD